MPLRVRTGEKGLQFSNVISWSSISLTAWQFIITVEEALGSCLLQYVSASISIVEVVNVLNNYMIEMPLISSLCLCLLRSCCSSFVFVALPVCKN